MADDQNQLPLTPPPGGDGSGGSGAANIQPVNIEEEMKRSYLDYSMSVIIGRALPALSSGLVKSYVMNEAAVPAEAFDTSYSAANQNLILGLKAASLLGYPSDQEWATEWAEMNLDVLPVAFWNSTMESSDYLTRPQPLYYSRWTQQRPTGFVPDSDSGGVPQRGPWLGFFAANPSRVAMMNTFSNNDTILGIVSGVIGVWYAAQTTEKPNSNGNTNGVTLLPAITTNYSDEIQQYWARLSNTDGTQEAVWNNVCAVASACKHSNIIRQWAELAYWFPATASAVGNHVASSMTNYDFTQFDSLSLNLLKDFGPTHSYLKVAPYPSVWGAWQQVNGALK